MTSLFFLCLAPMTLHAQDEAPAEEPASAPEAAEEPASETAEEPAAEEPAAGAAEEPAAETAEEPAAETAEEPAAETAEEPAAETAPALVLPLAPVEPAPATAAGPFVVPKGEIRSELFGSGLERLGNSEDPGSVGFQISRARVGVTATLSENAKAVLLFDVRNNSGGEGVTVLESGEEISYDSYPADWDIHVPFAYLQGSFEALGMDHTLRIGVQKPLFGFRPSYENASGAYYMPHPVAFKDLGRRSGVIPSFDSGLAWSVKKQALGVDLQVMNGTGWRSVEKNLGKDVLLRVKAQPIDLVQVVASAVYSPETDGSTTLTWQAGAQMTRDPLRVLVEGIGGTRRSDGSSAGHLGGAVAVSGDLEVGACEAVDRISPTVSVQAYDKDTTTDGDGWLAIQAGGTAYFVVNSKLTSWAGIAWETMTNPQGTAPPGHSAALTVGMKY